MNTFLPYSDYKESAQVLDYRRLGKQRVEAYQILKVNSLGPITVKNGIEIKTPWYNHPAVMMWRGHEWALFDYTCAICLEWKRRGFFDSVYDKLDDLMDNFPLCSNLKLITGTQVNYPPWIGDEKFHSSHRASLLFKNPNWYGQFGWTEKPEINYIWPVRLKKN